MDFGSVMYSSKELHNQQYLAKTAACGSCMKHPTKVTALRALLKE